MEEEEEEGEEEGEEGEVGEEVHLIKRIYWLFIIKAVRVTY